MIVLLNRADKVEPSKNPFPSSIDAFVVCRPQKTSIVRPSTCRGVACRDAAFRWLTIER